MLSASDVNVEPSQVAQGPECLPSSLGSNCFFFLKRQDSRFEISV